MSTQTLEHRESKPPAHTGKYKRLTRDDLAIIRTMDKAGKTQVEIAQALGCNQSSVSKWLAAFVDTRDDAKAYLAGQALPMARNIVKKGLPRDHVAALKGLSVLEEERSSGLTIQIGCKDSDVSISLSPLDLAGEKRKGSESLVISRGSDKAGYANQGEGS